MHSFVVGESVRVVCQSGDHSEIATVSYWDGETMKADVIFDNLRSIIEEEEVPVARILKRFDFEKGTFQNCASNAQEWKQCGNLVFGQKDWAFASKCYIESVKILEKEVPLSIGSEVYFFEETSGECLIGMISSIESNDVEVIVDDTDDEVVVARDLLSPVSTFKELHRANYLNLARCSLKRNLIGWAVRYASIALAMSYSLQSNDKASAKSVADCLYVRGRALLQAGRPALAKMNCLKLSELDPEKASLLEIDVDTFVKDRRKDNKKLAHEVSKWIMHALDAKEASPTA